MLVYCSRGDQTGHLSKLATMQGRFMQRWKPEMLPHLPQEFWVKSSQWLSLTRPHAQLIDADTLIVSIFEQHCLPQELCVGDVSRRPPPANDEPLGFGVLTMLSATTPILPHDPPPSRRERLGLCCIDAVVHSSLLWDKAILKLHSLLQAFSLPGIKFPFSLHLIFSPSLAIMLHYFRPRLNCHSNQNPVSTL